MNSDAPQSRTITLPCRGVWVVVCLLLSSPLAAAQETTVGMSGKLEAVVLPGSELEAKPLADRKAPVVLRVVRVYPHGTSFRYDLEYFALTPGTHDLREYLRRKDGSPLGELPPLTVNVVPTLPPGQVEPHKLEVTPLPGLGGYTTLVIVALSLWAFGLVVIVWSFLPKRKAVTAASDKPVSLSDRLRPLVEGAVAGRLSRVELADLERSLLAFWRKRLSLETVEPSVAIEALRNHPEAGPLLAQLEAWLHKPGEPASVDVSTLLAPYRDLPPEALELGGTK